MPDSISPEVTAITTWDDDGEDESPAVRSCMDDICRNTGQCMWECWREPTNKESP